MLHELTLWGERDKVQIAIDRFRQFEPSEGYFLAFSGGKDSIVIYHLAMMADVKFDAHYSVTTVDPPELLRFIRENYPIVDWIRPQLTMWQLIKTKGIPPLRNRRYCCEVLKEANGANRVVVTGIRWEESNRRARRRMIESCFKDASKTYFHPIIDWTNDDVWEFIRSMRLPYCRLYDEGFIRLGCVLCPMNNKPEIEMIRWPKIAANYVRTFDAIIEKHRKDGRLLQFSSGQEMFTWWIQRHLKAPNPDQMVMFE